MKTNKLFGMMSLIVGIMLAFSFTACDGGGDDNNGGGGTAPTITTTSLQGGTVGTAYSQTLTATGDTPITWSKESGTLPNGLTLSTAGVISGNPTTANTFTFTVKATNDAGSKTKSLSITIASGSGGGGTLTITNIPAQYNGKFIYVPPMNNPSLIVVGCDSIDRTTDPDTYTFSTITNGSVTIPMWKREGATENWTLVRYSGNDTLTILNIAILNVKTATQEISTTSPSTLGIFNFANDKKATAFVNGSATKSWNDGTVWTPPVGGSTYIITGSGTTFTATKNSVTVGTPNQTIDKVITAIQTDANGANCTIQFGDGTTALDIGTSGISFNNSGGTWGNITLSGKLKTDRSSYAVHITNGVTISSTAEIKNSGGTSIENSGTSIENYGTVNINGGTLSPVYNGGTLTIINGTITTTGTRYAIDNSGGTAIISGATISSTSSTNSAIRNNNGGTMTINSGTISSTTVSTIQNFSSLTIIGGTITSAVTTNSSSGTIVNQSVTGSTGILTITGGTVQNTAEGYAVNHMGGIYASGTVTITSPPTVIDKAKTTGNITWLP